MKFKKGDKVRYIGEEGRYIDVLGRGLKVGDILTIKEGEGERKVAYSFEEDRIYNTPNWLNVEHNFELVSRVDKLEKLKHKLLGGA